MTVSMKSNTQRLVLAASFVLIGTTANAQISDLLTTFDSGTRSTGAGGMLNGVGADPGNATYNPASIAFVGKRAISVSYRNLPTSRTTASGPIENPSRSTDGRSGKSEISSLNVSFPVGRGVFGISYGIAGFLDDTEGGQVNIGGNVVETYRANLKSRTDLYNLTYAWTTKDQMSSYGVGLVFAQQDTTSNRLVIQDGSTLEDQQVRESGDGFGFMLGYEHIPKSLPNMTLGLSYRSEINLNYSGNDPGLYDSIPARLMASVAMRQDGFRGGQDFLVYGLQTQYHFSAQGDGGFRRKAQFLVGVGAEYNYRLNEARIPVRIGYQVGGKGNSVFDSRNVFTFGFGYRPIKDSYTIDVNYGIPRGGGYDMAITLGYRF